jgi:hypothetical protein
MKSQMKMRLLHFHSFCKNRVAFGDLLSEPFAINDKPPDECNAKNN